MSKHLGTIKSRITAEVTLTGIFAYTDYKYSYYGTTHYTYIMTDAEGNSLVWKTTNDLMLWDEKKEENDMIRKGDTMSITGTVKEHTDYKGVPQTVLTRCKFSLVSHAPTEDALNKAKAEQQMQTLEKGDFIWEMPYRQYKEHYSDCETISGSYNDHNGEKHPTIAVIIRNGRLKNSGVRGKHYSGYEFIANDGTKAVRRAVSEENARKRLEKDYPELNGWECTKIYDYRNHRCF